MKADNLVKCDRAGISRYHSILRPLRLFAAGKGDGASAGERGERDRRTIRLVGET